MTKKTEPTAFDLASPEQKALVRAIVEGLRKDLARVLLQAAEEGKAERAANLHRL